MKKLIITLISSALVASFLIGFIDVSTPNGEKNNDEVIYSISEIPTDFKAVGSLDKRAQDIVTATSRGLVEINENNEIKPSLAESVEVRDDGLEYDFKIRSDVFWSDGTKITPKDIATFFREILTEENEENIAALLNVYGAQRFRNGEGSFTEDVGIRFNEENIIFRLNSKDDKFIEELTTPQYRIRKNVLLWENIKKNYANLIYSGNYKIEGSTMSELNLKRNEKTNKNIVDRITIIPYEGEEVAMASFEVGGRDLVINPPKSQLNRLSSEGRLINLKSNKAMYLAFNPKDTTLKVEGRREVYRLVNKALEEYEIKNSMYIELAEGSYFREDKENLEKLQARKVMSTEDREWVKPEVLHIVAKEGSENKEICDYLSSWFENNTDINLVYDLITSEELNSIDEANYYDFAIIQGDLTLSNEASIYNSLVKFLDSDNKEKLLLAKTEGDRLEKFLSIEEELFSNYSVLPLVFYNDNIAINKEIKNLVLDGNGNINFNEIQK
ncbi:ABC transporter substrate-binding protein [Clostridium sp. AL.422]|uniref:ABC transporter substrate-binding protein n=1 Tax=Clostridium TaxID=1485 RepID=UPI00293DC6D4|nr:MULTISPECIES: ABC transporter substrate-binding protein [unclassified Clostridium]MDV4151480.1 ABC transporter substrate-binding protein [Clostridium sp. AL.422]